MTEHQDLRDITVSSELRRIGPTLEPVVAALRTPDLATAFAYIRRRFRLVMACVVIGGGLSAAAGLLIGPSFTATALLAVAEPEGAEPTGTESAVDTQIAMLESQAFLTRAYEAMIADPLLHGAADSVTTLERRMKVLQASKSRLISVSYTAKSAAVAAGAANKIVRLYVEDPVLQSVQSVDDVTLQYADRIKELESRLATLSQPPAADDANDRRTEQGQLRDQIANLKLNEMLVRRRQESRRQTLAMAPPVQLVALSTPPTHRSSMNALFMVAPGGLFSALFGLGLALTLGRLDSRIYTREQLEGLVRRYCASEIPPRRHRRSRKKTLREQDLARMRAVESLVARVFLLSARRPRLIMLAAADIGAHGAPIAQDIAAAAARLSIRVLLVDLDFWRVRPHLSPPQNTHGLEFERRDPDVFDVLAGRRAVLDAIDRDPSRGYHLLPMRRPIADDPFALIASDRLRQLFNDLYFAYDLILVEAPPMAELQETQIVSTFMDAALLFVRAGASREKPTVAAFAKANEALGLNSGNLRPQLWATLIDAPVASRTAETLAATLAQATHKPVGKLSEREGKAAQCPVRSLSPLAGGPQEIAE